MNNSSFVVICIISVFISSVSQILLKKESVRAHDNVLKEYLNFRIIFAYFLFFISTFLTMYSLKALRISTVTMLESLGYLFVYLLSFFVFGEVISKKKKIGVALILIGIAVFTF